MNPDIFTDEEWARFLAIADPSIDLASKWSQWLRLKVGHILCGAYIGYRERRDRPQHKTFEDFAQAADLVIAGMRTLDAFNEELVFATLHFDPKADIRLKRYYNAPIAEQITKYAEAFRSAAAFVRKIKAEDVREGSNSKEWLHSAVHQLHDVWQDELKQGGRPKKDFLYFAYSLLGPLCIGITENSILESFDRHVRKRMHVRRRLMVKRQTAP